MAEQGRRVSYKFGTMIEIPRAALTADELARFAQFFSFGTNDLTQMTFGISRDDAEKGFLLEYLAKAILPRTPSPRSTSPESQVDEDGGRARPDDAAGMEIGICGEHGGDPSRSPSATGSASTTSPAPLPHPHRPPRRGPGLAQERG